MRETIIDYTVVVGSEVYIHEKVKRLIKEGWELHGGVGYGSNGFIAQAMVIRKVT